MDWVMFLFGVMVGSMVGISTMCIVFWGRGPEIR